MGHRPHRPIHWLFVARSLARGTARDDMAIGRRPLTMYAIRHHHYYYYMIPMPSWALMGSLELSWCSRGALFVL